MASSSPGGGDDRMGYHPRTDSMDTVSLSSTSGPTHVRKGSLLSVDSFTMDDRALPTIRSSPSNSSLSSVTSHHGNHNPSSRSQWLTSSLGSQNLVSVLNDPTQPRSYAETILTKDWGGSFVEGPVQTKSVIVSKQEFEFMQQYMRHLRKRMKVLNRFHQLSQLNAANRAAINTDMALKQIPVIFLDPDFDSSKQETFDQILDIVKVMRPSTSLSNPFDPPPNPFDPPSKSPSNPFEGPFTSDYVMSSHQVLSDVLDRVEDHLSNQIAARFRDFFQVMTAMDSVMDQVSKTIKDVTTLRGKCDLMKSSLVKPRMRSVHLNECKNNLMQYLHHVSLMHMVCQSNSTVNMMLSSRNYVDALDLISRSRDITRHHLKGVKCLTHLDSELGERQLLIEKFLDQDLKKLLTNEWIVPFGSPSSSPRKMEQIGESVQEESSNVLQVPESNRSSARSSPIPHSDFLLDDEENLVNIITGMMWTQQFKFVDEIRDQGDAAIVTIIKQTLIAALSKEDIELENRSEDALYNKLKDVMMSKWMVILDEVFYNLSSLLKKVSSVIQVVLKTIHLSCSKEWTPPIGIPDVTTAVVVKKEITMSDEQFSNWTLRTKDSIVMLCDFAQGRASGLIKKRFLDSGDQMDPIEFHRFASAVQCFGSFCDTLSGTPCPKLRVTLEVEANRFASNFHDGRKKQLITSLNQETWKSVDYIPKTFIDLVTNLMKGEMGSPSSPVKGDLKSNGCAPTIPTIPSCSHLKLDGDSFQVVNSVMLVITLLSDYCSSATELPILSPELLVRVIDLMKTFTNSSFNLVFMGQAKLTQSLKSVTPRVLINCSRALDLIRTIIPAVGSHFLPLLPKEKESLLSKQLDDVADIYVNHSSKLVEKVVISNREFMTIKLSRWEGKPPIPSSPFLAITQHLGVLDANLQDALPPDLLTDLFHKIDSSFKVILRSQLDRLNIKNDGGPQHGLVTQEMIFYTQTMSKKHVGKFYTFSPDLWTKS